MDAVEADGTLPQRLVGRQRPARDRLVDPGQILLDDRSGTEVQMPDLAVAHLAVGQADGAATGAELCVRVAREQAVHRRRVGQRDGVTGPRWCDPPAIEDDQRSGGPDLVHHRIVSVPQVEWRSTIAG